MKDCNHLNITAVYEWLISQNMKDCNRLNITAVYEWLSSDHEGLQHFEHYSCLWMID